MRKKKADKEKTKPKKDKDEKLKKDFSDAVDEMPPEPVKAVEEGKDLTPTKPAIPAEKARELAAEFVLLVDKIKKHAKEHGPGQDLDDLYVQKAELEARIRRLK